MALPRGDRGPDPETTRESVERLDVPAAAREPGRRTPAVVPTAREQRHKRKGRLRHLPVTPAAPGVGGSEREVGREVRREVGREVEGLVGCCLRSPSGHRGNSSALPAKFGPHRGPTEGMTRNAAPSTTSTGPTGPPAFLTIEEAAAVLRIGRTAAYLLAGRWEDTSGAEGLPVVRFGRLLRVPVHELQRLAGGAIDLTRRSSTDTPTPPTSLAPPGPSSTSATPKPRRADDVQPSVLPEAS